MPYTQSNRLIAIETPLGADVLLLRGFTGQEGISQLFNFDLDLSSHDPDIKFEDIIGKRVTLRVTLGSDKERYFNGFISKFAQIHCETGLTTYKATMVPWLWFLTRTSDCRMFQDKVIPEIIETIFADSGFTDFKLLGLKDFEKLDYCVQYRETDFNFVSRLMEQYGIFYFFEHEKDKHTLILANDPSACPRYKEEERTKGVAQGSGALVWDVITSFQCEQSLRPGKYAVTDYNFETPRLSLHAEMKSTPEVGGNGKFEIYDYPGEYSKKNQGDTIARLRMEEEEAQCLIATGTSTCWAFTSGYRFDLKDYVRKDMNQTYVLTTVSHFASVGSTYTSGSVGTDESDYSNSFACIPHKVPFRPPRVTSKPVVPGAQTAVVSGKSGEEIWTDQYGRVKVQFHWDRDKKEGENRSCYIRVAQNWAGKRWGAMFIPRIGQEVIVEFLEGDPDRPIITGCVYNKEQMPPYELPANQTQSGIKSRSSKGGSPDNFNEIRFEDMNGSEEVYIHAEKDENVVVENDQTIAVGNDRAESIKRDRSLEVGRDKSEKVLRNKSIQVIGGHTEQIAGSMNITVGSTLTESVLINYAETVGGAMELTVGGALAVTVGAAMAETVGGAKAESVGGAKSENIGLVSSLNVGGNRNETIGKSQVIAVSKDLSETIGGQHKESVTKEYILNAKKIQLLAEDEVTITTGKAQIIMKKNGDITFNGKKVNEKGSGDVTIKGSKVKVN